MAPAGFGFSPLLHASTHGSVSLQHGGSWTSEAQSYHAAELGKRSLSIPCILCVGKDIETEGSVVL
jgi:hypothetical protein